MIADAMATKTLLKPKATGQKAATQKGMKVQKAAITMALATMIKARAVMDTERVAMATVRTMAKAQVTMAAKAKVVTVAMAKVVTVATVKAITVAMATTKV
tara:strand:+ start:7181 stop:7483 length:303 start_codon:yes stop_codon:yes gene_type:complete